MKVAGEEKLALISENEVLHMKLQDLSDDHQRAMKASANYFDPNS